MQPGEQGELPSAMAITKRQQPRASLTDMEAVKDTLRRIDRAGKSKQLKAYEDSKAFRTFSDAETAKLVLLATDQRKELLENIKLLKEAETALVQKLAYGQESRSMPKETEAKLEKQVVELRDKLKALRRFRLEFDAKWNFDKNGHPKTPTAWEKATGNRFFARLRTKVMADLKLAAAIERELLGLPPQYRELRLLEYQRMDFLTPTERRIYARNMISFQDHEQKEPISWGLKLLGWVLVLIINGAFGAYVAYFGLKQGGHTINSWLASFIASMLQDPLLNVPLAILFYNVYLPLHIKQKLKLAIDGASDAPFVFKAFIPPGPASRCVTQGPGHREVFVSSADT